MTQSPQPRTFTNFELSISIRLDDIYLFDLHQLIVMPHVCVMSAYPPKADISECSRAFFLLGRPVGGLFHLKPSVQCRLLAQSGHAPATNQFSNQFSLLGEKRTSQQTALTLALSRRAEDRSQTTKFVQTPRQGIFPSLHYGPSRSWLAGINHYVSEPEMPPINFVGAST